jgi:hypothetical protein
MQNMIMEAMHMSLMFSVFGGDGGGGGGVGGVVRVVALPPAAGLPDTRAAAGLPQSKTGCDGRRLAAAARGG